MLTLFSTAPGEAGVVGGSTKGFSEGGCSLPAGRWRQVSGWTGRFHCWAQAGRVLLWGVLWHSPDVALDSGKLRLVLFKEANQPKQYLGGSTFISCERSVFIMEYDVTFACVNYTKHVYYAFWIDLMYCITRMPGRLRLPPPRLLRCRLRRRIPLPRSF